jgi:hypothetical protein
MYNGTPVNVTVQDTDLTSTFKRLRDACYPERYVNFPIIDTNIRSFLCFSGIEKVVDAPCANGTLFARPCRRSCERIVVWYRFMENWGLDNPNHSTPKQCLSVARETLGGILSFEDQCRALTDDPGCFGDTPLAPLSTATALGPAFGFLSIATVAAVTFATTL